MSTPEEMFRLVALFTAIEDNPESVVGDLLGGLDLEDFICSLAKLVDSGWLQWIAEESAFALTIPGQPDTGARVYVPVPSVDEVNGRAEA